MEKKDKGKRDRRASFQAARRRSSRSSGNESPGEVEVRVVCGFLGARRGFPSPQFSVEEVLGKAEGGSPGDRRPVAYGLSKLRGATNLLTQSPRSPRVPGLSSPKSASSSRRGSHRSSDGTDSPPGSPGVPWVE